MLAQIQIRRDTYNNWQASSSVILSTGEIGIEFPNSNFILNSNDSIKFKVGDGTNTWAALPYYSGKLTELRDVVTSSLQNYDILSYDSASGEWINVSTSSLNGVFSFIELNDTPSTYSGFEGYILQVSSSQLVFISTGSFATVSQLNLVTQSFNTLSQSFNAYTQSTDTYISNLNVHSESINNWTSSFSSSVYNSINSLSSSIDTTITNLSSSIASTIAGLTGSGATEFIQLTDTPASYGTLLTSSIDYQYLVYVDPYDPTGSLVFVDDSKYLYVVDFNLFTASYYTDSASFYNWISTISSSLISVSSSFATTLNNYSASVSISFGDVYNFIASISSSFSSSLSASYANLNIPRYLGDLYDVNTGSVPITNGDVLTWDNSFQIWRPWPVGGTSSGVNEFIELIDAPSSSYTGSKGKIIQVNQNETRLVYLNTESFTRVNLMKDVNTSSLSNGDYLAWNSASGEWRPSVPTTYNEFIELQDTPATYAGAAGYFVAVNASSSALEFIPTSSLSASLLYTNTASVPSTIGGIAAGTTFTNQTMQQMWDALLYPYQTPSFSTFTISGQSTPIEVGDSILSNRTFTWTTANSYNVSPNTIMIENVTDAIQYVSGSANDGSETVTMAAISRSLATSVTFRITAAPTQGSNITKTYAVAWQWRRFYGESLTVPLTETDIEGLRVSGLASAYAGTYAFAAGGYKYLCYPSSFGTATTFKDSSTNLDVPFEAVYTVSVTNTYGITTNYNVHRSTNIIGSSISIIVS